MTADTSWSEISEASVGGQFLFPVFFVEFCQFIRKDILQDTFFIFCRHFIVFYDTHYFTDNAYIIWFRFFAEGQIIIQRVQTVIVIPLDDQTLMVRR